MEHSHRLFLIGLHLDSTIYARALPQATPLSRLVIRSIILPVKPLDRVQHDAKNVLWSEQHECFIDGVFGGASRPDHHEAGVCVLFERQSVRERENGWGVD